MEAAGALRAAAPILESIPTPPGAQWGIELILGPFMVHLGNFGMEADICIHNNFWPK